MKTLYKYTAAVDEPSEIKGWLNGTVVLTNGRSFDAGGGWVEHDGRVDPYNYGDAGAVDELADALGLDVEATMQLLRADCPQEWVPE